VRLIQPAPLLALLVLACAGGGQAARPSPSLPAGYTSYDGSRLGFRMGLAPGWRASGEEAPDGVGFDDPSRQATLLVHVGRARSSDLTAATAAVVFDLTGGTGTSGGRESDTTLGGRPARRVTGAFEAGGTALQIEAVVMVASGRDWVLALAGPPATVAADETDFGRMRATFRLLPNPPPLPEQAGA
jgi:hypothetical protein